VTPKCTLVAVSFRNFGYQLLDSWIKPFEDAFASSSISQPGNSNARAIRVSITERWTLYPLRGILNNIMKQNTPASDYANTMTYFGTDVEEFRDVLRMHNIMTGYVFLLDDLGRVRFAGSGPATDEDIAKIIGCGKQLIAESGRSSGGGNKRIGRRRPAPGGATGRKVRNKRPM